MDKLKVGDRVYNHGDQANMSHFGTVTAIHSSGQYEITPDRDEAYPIGSYHVSPAMVSPEFKGHSGTRIVKAEAYHTWRDQRMLEVYR